MSTDARGRNEYIFRAANDAVQANRETPSDELLAFLCECSSTACEADIDLTVAEYATLRTSERRFAIATGHEDLEIERVVDEFDRYTVVEKQASQ